MEMKQGGEKWGGTKDGRLFELATVLAEHRPAAEV